MTTKQFLTQLSNYPEAPLLFEFQPGQYVGMAYHITEIKNTHVDSVDCGANTHSFDQTVVQLWISEGEEARDYMSATKAKKIFDIVQTKTTLLDDAEILFEYGDADTPVIVYPVDQVIQKGERLIVQLKQPQTACKPRLAVAEPVGACKPGGGCC